jgi:hypothetical protein
MLPLHHARIDIWSVRVESVCVCSIRMQSLRILDLQLNPLVYSVKEQSTFG